MMRPPKMIQITSLHNPYAVSKSPPPPPPKESSAKATGAHAVAPGVGVVDAVAQPGPVAAVPPVLHALEGALETEGVRVGPLHGARQPACLLAYRQTDRRSWGLGEGGTRTREAERLVGADAEATLLLLLPHQRRHHGVRAWGTSPLSTWPV